MLMQMFLQELGTRVTAMTVKYTEVTDFNVLSDSEILDALVGVFHVVTLAHVLGDCCVKTLYQEFKLSNSKGIVWFEV